MICQAWPCQEERAGLSEFDRVELFDASTDAAEADNQSLRPGCPHAVAQGGLANRVEHDVDPAAAGQFAYRVSESTVIVQKRCSSAAIASHLRFRLGARRRVYGCP